MSLVMEKNEAPNPIDIAFFRPIRVMLDTDSLSDLVEKLLWRSFHREEIQRSQRTLVLNDTGISGQILKIYGKFNLDMLCRVYVKAICLITRIG
jgi:hypothetical protein